MIRVGEMIGLLEDAFYDVILVDESEEEHYGEIDESSSLIHMIVSSVMPYEEDGEIVVGIYVDMSDDV